MFKPKCQTAYHTTTQQSQDVRKPSYLKFNALKTLAKSNQATPDCGTEGHLTTLGEDPVSLPSSNGAQHSTTIYVVQGHKVEPLLGEEDAKALGILTINKGGHTPLTLLHQHTLQASEQTYGQLASK